MRLVMALGLFAMSSMTTVASAKEPPSAYAIPIEQYQTCLDEAESVAALYQALEQGETMTRLKRRITQSDFKKSTREIMLRTLVEFKASGAARVQEHYMPICVYPKLRPAGGGWID